ncbi:MAG: hypothetical protein AAFZ87_08795 [Planctomycetota bacterium]
MLKPQDLLVAVKLALPGLGERWTYPELARALDLSDSEANSAAHRASDAGLMTRARGRTEKPKPIRSALMEFVAHGLRYAFYVRPGEVVRGVPTGHSAPPLDEQFPASELDALVWPDARGTLRGQAITPLYPSVPAVARRDAALHETLALLDAIRTGREREVCAALDEFRKRIGGERGE